MVEKQKRGGKPHPWRRVTPPAPNWPRPWDSLLPACEEPLSVLLWRGLRDVLAWARLPEGERSSFFGRVSARAADRLREAIEEYPDLADALVDLAHFPESAAGRDPECMARLCMRLARWLEGRGLVASAAHYAEAAAFSDPEDPAPANQAGRLCRRIGDDQRAEMWYLRAIGLARSTGNRFEYIRAHQWYGFFLFQKGRAGGAARHYRAAGTMARKAGFLSQAGIAHHNLLTIASDAGRYGRGEAHARAALTCYPVHHPRVPHLAHDFAYLLLRCGWFEPALHLLRCAEPLIAAPHERVVALGNLGRAAAATGDRHLHDEAAAKVLVLASQSRESASRGLLGIAYGAFYLGDLVRADKLARSALDLASSAREEGPRALAASLLEQIGAAKVPADVPDLPSTGERLVREMELRLKKWTAPPRGQAVHMLRRLRSSDIHI